MDPANVTRLALQNETSVAGLLLTTEVMFAEAPKEDDHALEGAETLVTSRCSASS